MTYKVAHLLNLVFMVILLTCWVSSSGPRSSRDVQLLDPQGTSTSSLALQNNTDLPGNEGRTPESSSAGFYNKTEEPRAPYFPKLDKMHRFVIKPAGNMLRLKCNSEGNPMPNITWFKDWAVPERQLGTIQYSRWSIILEDLVVSDSGNYTCVVCNIYGCINFTYKVEVLERLPHKPVFSESLKNMTVHVGTSARFHCLIVSDLEPFIQWYRLQSNDTETNFEDNKSKNSKFVKVNNISNVTPEILTISNVTYEDEGWYTCEAGNALGYSQSTAYLKVVDNSNGRYLFSSSEANFSKISISCFFFSQLFINFLHKLISDIFI